MKLVTPFGQFKQIETLGEYSLQGDEEKAVSQNRESYQVILDTRKLKNWIKNHKAQHEVVILSTWQIIQENQNKSKVSCKDC